MDVVEPRELSIDATRQRHESNGVQLSVRNVFKRFGPFTALDDVSLDIYQGEFLTLLGPSGSGKSTFLNILAGFDSPTAGHIVQAGRDLTSVPPEARNFGMVFQGYALFPHMTVAENVAFPLRVRKVPTEERTKQVREILAQVGLTAHADKHPNKLSGGQQQRVALARALVFSPHILLLDEPFSALDRNLREQLQFEVKRIHREFEKTFVFVTHDQTEALSMSDRIAIFHNGRLCQIGSPEEVYRWPRTEFVATFLGRMNLFRIEDVSSGAGMVRGRFGSRELKVFGAAEGACQIAVRPEGTTLSATEPGENLNSVPVTVRGVAYHGATVFLEVAPVETSAASLTITMLTDAWERDFDGTRDALWLGWEPARGLVMPCA